MCCSHIVSSHLRLTSVTALMYQLALHLLSLFLLSASADVLYCCTKVTPHLLDFFTFFSNSRWANCRGNLLISYTVLKQTWYASERSLLGGFYRTKMQREGQQGHSGRWAPFSDRHDGQAVIAAGGIPALLTSVVSPLYVVSDQKRLHLSPSSKVVGNTMWELVHLGFELAKTCLLGF